MKNSIKNITVNGINYYLVGNCYMPTASGLVPDRRTGVYGMIHLKYLQMAHPDDVVELIASGRIRQYLLRVDLLVKQYIQDREKLAPIPQLSDPAFEEKYIRHNSVSHNAACKAENKYILSGLHRDILAGIKEPDSEPIDKVFKITIQDDERTSEVSFEEWLDRHPFEKIAFMKAKDVRRKYKKSRPPCGSFEQCLDMHPYEKEIYDRAERIRRKYKKDCVLRRREKECALHRKEVHRYDLQCASAPVPCVRYCCRGGYC